MRYRMSVMYGQPVIAATRASVSFGHVVGETEALGPGMHTPRHASSDGVNAHCYSFA